MDAADDLDAVRAALRSRLQADGRIHSERPLKIFVQEWATGKRTPVVTAWTATADYLAVQQEFLEELGKSVEATRTPNRDHS